MTRAVTDLPSWCPKRHKELAQPLDLCGEVVPCRAGRGGGPVGKKDFTARFERFLELCPCRRPAFMCCPKSRDLARRVSRKGEDVGDLSFFETEELCSETDATEGSCSIGQWGIAKHCQESSLTTRSH